MGSGGKWDGCLVVVFYCSCFVFGFCLRIVFSLKKKCKNLTTFFRLSNHILGNLMINLFQPVLSGCFITD